jgi:ubiquinone biosynthesis protein
VPGHHNVEEFATALRAVGEPMRGKPASELSVGGMLDGLFAITRDFDMQTQPHLLLLQKTMVMVEGVAHQLDPEINMWETSGPYVKEWLRTELGPEAKAADALIENWRLIQRLPALVRRIEDAFPEKGGAPPPLPLGDVKLIQVGGGWRYGLVALLAAAIGAGAMAAATTFF